MAGLVVQRATVRVGSTEILTDVSVRIAAGAVTVIIGPNGAGKSTLLAVAAGTRRPDSGTVLLGDDDIRRLGVADLAQRRAVMPQDTTVAFPFTVAEVVAMGRTAWRSGRRETDAVTAEALELTGMTSFHDRIITTLSGGEHQRIAFARVIAQATPVGPDSVILLDEPTAAMDIAHGETTLSTARELSRQGAAVGVVLHDLDAAAAYADRVVLMHHGRVHAAGTVAEVCREDVLSDVYQTPIEVYSHGGRIRIAPRRG